jgi:hypothetical protein
VGARVRGRVHEALLIQHTKRMGSFVTSFAATWSPSHFSTLSHKRQHFRKKVIAQNVLIFSIPFV